MLRFVKHIVWLLGVMIGCESAFGFALIGPPLTQSPNFPDIYQIQNNGFNPGNSDGANPRDIREEYRRNTPVIYYAVDTSFFEYFRDRGVAEIDKAMAMYNSLPNASVLNIDDYPEDSRRPNFRAAADGLQDLKSSVMGLISQQVGLFEPTRWVWALHDRNQLPPPPGAPSCPFNMEYSIFHLNFSPDPVGEDTYPTTSYVNGVLYSYFIDEFCSGPPPLADAVEFPVDPLSAPFSAVADFSSLWYVGLPVGGFYTSLTRDDVAGIKYLINTNNFNNEASGARTIEFVTNSVVAAITNQDLGALASAARTNNAAALTALFPGLIISSTSNFFGLQITTNITELLVNSPNDPAGLPPSHPIFSTNYSTNFATFFVHTFANVVTNSFATHGVMGVISLSLASAPFAPAGLVVTTNGLLTLKPVPISGVFGDFFILPTNLCGAQVLSNFLTQVTTTTNLPTTIAGPTTNSITFIPGSITFSTNHVVIYLPVTCPVDSVAMRAGVDRIIFVRRDYDSITSQSWDPVTNDYTLVEETDVTNKIFEVRHFQRRVPRPDLLFSAADLGTDNGNIIYSNTVDNATATFTLATFTGFETEALAFEQHLFNDIGRSTAVAGPGTIVDPTILPTIFIMNKLAPLFDNFSPTGGSTNGFLQPGELTQAKLVGWGSFDGTTNAPIVYPNGTALDEFEGELTGPAASTRYLPDANAGSPYSAQLTAVGGNPPYTWALAPGSSGLPAGLNLSSDGQITGTPSGPPAIYDFTVRLTDSTNAFRDTQFTITVF